MLAGYVLRYYRISIRAPARGATILSIQGPIRFSISIRAPARGATSRSTVISSSFFYFNPRSREGSDVIVRVPIIVSADFNPRSREGSDL